MSTHDVDECKKEIADLKKLIYGDTSTGKGGMAHVVENLGETVWGGKINPIGLVGDVASIKKFLWGFGGAMIAAQVALQFIFKLWP